MIDIVLIEARKQKNLGAAARVMKNFGFSNLILIEPKCKIGGEARKVAKHAQDILTKAKTKEWSYLKRYDYVIGTTAILGRDYNIPRNPITPSQFAEKISRIEKKARIALLIGRESSGLTNKEIKQCDMLVHIPSSKKYPTLNVSHSLSIILYELFQKEKNKTSDHIATATKKEKNIILKFFNKIIDTLEFEAAQKKETQRKVWKRVVGKAVLTKREAFSVMGFLRKITERLDKK